MSFTIMRICVSRQYKSIFINNHVKKYIKLLNNIKTGNQFIVLRNNFRFAMLK